MPCSRTRTFPAQPTYGLEFPDQPVLAIDRVRYYGEPVALVAAEHPEEARRAAEAIVVEYEPLELVVDPERATEQEPLHPDRPTMGHGYRDDPRPNVVRSIVIRHGDPDVEGDVSVEGVYELGSQDQAFLGPESGLAVPDGEGGIDIHVATQWLHVDRDQIAPCLGARAASRCGFIWPASAGPSAAARISRSRSMPRCSRSTPTGR